MAQCPDRLDPAINHLFLMRIVDCSDVGVLSQAGRHVERPLQPQHPRLLLLRLAGGLRPAEHQQTQVGGELGEGRRDHYWRHNTGTVGSPPCISQTNTRVSTKLGQVEVGHCIASHNPNFGHN